MNGLKPWQQEKHYMQAMVLNSLSEYPIVFKGGTYLWFFHGLHRFSEDLDFTISGELPESIWKKTSKALGLFGVENGVKLLIDDNKTLSFRIMAEGPLYTNEKDRCVVYVEASKREGILSKTVSLRFEYPEYQLPIKHIVGMGLDEVGAEKARAILTRKKARDVYDLYYLIDKKGIPFNIELIKKKIGPYRISFSKPEFMRAVMDRQANYARELKSLIFGDLPDFNTAYKTIEGWVGQI